MPVVKRGFTFVATICVALSVLSMIVLWTKYGEKVKPVKYSLPEVHWSEKVAHIERDFYTRVAVEQNRSALTITSRATSSSTTVSSTTITTSSKSTSNAVARKVVVMPARMIGAVKSSDFQRCQNYSSCVYRFTDKTEEMNGADVIVMEFNSLALSKVGALKLTPRQSISIVFGLESPGYSWNKWKTVINNFNGSMTYVKSSTIYFPYGAMAAIPIERVRNVSTIPNYAEGKTKGAFTYVSNCNSMHYNRLEVMKKLSKYIDVDIYGQCTHNAPCKTKADIDCEASVHSKYRFYFAFENSLCKDYITEKFWKTLRSSAYFIPVVIGGLSIEDYNEVSPPNSFIHAYNFSSIKQLGEYLQHLTNDDAAFNRYHQWRHRFEIVNQRHQVACDLCEIAHNPEKLRGEQSTNFADDWNNPQNCRNDQFS